MENTEYLIAGFVILILLFFFYYKSSSSENLRGNQIYTAGANQRFFGSQFTSTNQGTADQQHFFPDSWNSEHFKSPIFIPHTDKPYGPY